MPKWLFYTLLTVLLWGLWGVVSKQASSSLSAWQLQAVSTVGILPVIGVLWWMCRNSVQAKEASARRGIVESFAAGLLGGIGNVAYFHALSLGGKAAAVIPLTALYPIATIALATIVLRERLNVIQILGVALSLVAIYLFNVSNSSGLLTTWIAYSLIPIVLWGVGGFLQKLATFRISGELCTLAFLLGFLPLSVIVIVQNPNISSISVDTFWLSALVGLLFALGNLTVIFAYGTGGKAAIVTPIASLYSVVTVPLAIAFLGEQISWRERLGIATALLAVVALCYERPGESPTSAEPHSRSAT
jgi:transporter family protein